MCVPTAFCACRSLNRAAGFSFSVYNQGKLIPPERLSKIWEAFYRDKDAKYSGSGLGLAIVAQILSMQRLEYGVENLADGVQFFFVIPTIE